MGYDRYPEKFIDEKQALYQRLLAQSVKLFFTHDDSLACGELVQQKNGRYTVIACDL